ncbi:MAG: hypothetical protein JXJ04_12990 [Spirochaetales bacterium]|nr:hypothetical protein [Spirochaetales bacterium]
MDWDGIDLREYERKEGSLVPECFRNFIIEQGTGKKIKVETTDFTVKGLRLLIPSTRDDIMAGDGLIIYPLDESFKLIGEIVYVVSLNENILYAGIRFLRTKSLENYIKIIEGIDITDHQSVHS